MRRRTVNRLLVAAAIVAAAPVAAPQLLAFPYTARVGANRVWSERPLVQPALSAVLAEADRLDAASPLAQAPEGRRIFLTDGGWRWHWLALTSAGAFGLTRPIGEAIVINRSDLAANRVVNGRDVGGVRTLSGVIAHETCHTMERRHFGPVAMARVPGWLSEGYCDHVAQESSLSAADVAALKTQRRSHPALLYYEGRQRVAATLRANGGNVDALFAGAR